MRNEGILPAFACLKIVTRDTARSFAKSLSREGVRYLLELICDRHWLIKCSKLSVEDVFQRFARRILLAGDGGPKAQHTEHLYVIAPQGVHPFDGRVRAVHGGLRSTPRRRGVKARQAWLEHRGQLGLELEPGGLFRHCFYHVCHVRLSFALV